MSQYPYELWKLVTPVQSRDAKGDYPSAGAGTWTLLGACRDEVNTSAAKIALLDGTAYVYAATIVGPLSLPVLSAGDAIEVRLGSTVRLAAKLRGFSRMQLHTRLWV